MKVIVCSITEVTLCLSEQLTLLSNQQTDVDALEAKIGQGQIEQVIQQVRSAPTPSGYPCLLPNSRLPPCPLRQSMNFD